MPSFKPCSTTKPPALPSPLDRGASDRPFLCQLRSERHGAGCEVCVGEEGSVDHVGEAAFEDAKRLGFVLAAFAAALKELTCGLVVVGLGDRDPVDRGVELSVAGAAEPVTRPVA